MRFRKGVIFCLCLQIRFLSALLLCHDRCQGIRLSCNWFQSFFDQNFLLRVPICCLSDTIISNSNVLFCCCWKPFSFFIIQNYGLIAFCLERSPLRLIRFLFSGLSSSYFPRRFRPGSHIKKRQRLGTAFHMFRGCSSCTRNRCLCAGYPLKRIMSGEFKFFTPHGC